MSKREVQVRDMAMMAAHALGREYGTRPGMISERYAEHEFAAGYQLVLHRDGGTWQPVVSSEYVGAAEFVRQMNVIVNTTIAQRTLARVAVAA